jgi:signal transduction histidine kinase
MEDLHAKLERIPEPLKDINLRPAPDATRLEGGFIAELAHELRTPLNGVIGFASLLGSAKAGPINEKQKEFLGNILTSAHHMLQLVNDVLDLAKLEAGKMRSDIEPVALAPLVEETCAAMQAPAEQKHLSICAVVDPSLGTAMLDRTRLKQVLFNFLSNAIKFTPEAGSIEVRVVPDRGDTIRIEVEDSGIGIAAEDLPRLFADFQQLEAGRAKQPQGTGLGLSLTRRIVEAQGGSVGVRSVPKVGSIFWAILPKTPVKWPHRVRARIERTTDLVVATGLR